MGRRGRLEHEGRPEEFQRGAGDRARAFNDGKIVDAQGDGVSLTEADGGTLISAGEGNSLFVANVTPDQLGASNITLDGEAFTNGSPLGSILSTFEDNNFTIEGEPVDEASTGGTSDDALASDDDQTAADAIAEDLVLKGGKGDDTLEGGAGDDTLAGGRGADTFIQDFGQPGEDTIADFNPNQDVIDFSGLNDFEKVSVSEVDGSTLISVGEGNTLTINNITPDQLSADNIKFDGEAPSADNFNLQSALGGETSDAAGGELDALSGALGGGETLTPGADGSVPADSALGNALDNTAQQGASPAGGLADGAAGSDIVADEAAEGAIDEEQVDEAAAGGG